MEKRARDRNSGLRKGGKKTAIKRGVVGQKRRAVIGIRNFDDGDLNLL